MRFSDVLVDLASVLHASRSVASKHVALRAGQLDRYSKSSSIIRDLKGRPQQPQYNYPPAHPQTTTSDARPPPEGDGSAAQSSHALPAQDQTVSPNTETLGSTSTPEVWPSSTPLSRRLRDVRGPRPAPPPPPPASSGKSEFVPAPWATLASSATVHRTLPSTLGATHGEAGAALLVEDDADAPEGINLNLFRTARGAKILEVLKEKEAEEDLGPESFDGSSVAPVEKPSTPVVPGRQAKVQTPSGEDDGPMSFDGSSVEAVPESTALYEGEVASELVSELEIAVLNIDQMMLEATSAVSDSGALLRKLDAQQPKDTETTFEALEKPDKAQPKPAVTASEAMENPAKAQAKLSKEDADLISDLTAAAPSNITAYQLRESKVPATRVSRLWNYGSLAAGMFGGAIAEGLSRAVGGGSQGSMLLSPGNMERLVAKLSRMRGAALKLGQMMSFQDSKMLPAPIQEVLQRVQDRADYMPAWQRDRVLTANLGENWRELFDRFDEKPIAAASIGQVHRATLKSTGAEVAVKIQFPGVADSINSDLDNLGVLLAATKVLPKGLYLNKTIDNARTELAWECDYEREAICGERYRSLLSDEPDVFLVPKIFLEASGKQVLTMEWMDGVGVTRMVNSFTQSQRDWIGTQILRLCLREITEFKFMQTDPNWTNFLYNPKTNKLELLDFGASREYPDKFIDLYVRLLEAASRTDRAAVKTLSEELGYLTGHESKAMLDAHTTSVLTLAEPFLDSAPEVYDFRDQTITERVKDQIPVMIRERLAPPPEETYSLHRKLSGAFLLCARLGSRVRCRDLFQEALKKTDSAK